MLSASDDQTMMLWDLRINKRIMLLQDKKEITSEVIKAKFVDSSYVVCAFGPKLALFDIRKPSIMVTQSKILQSEAKEELNDFDLCFSKETN